MTKHFNSASAIFVLLLAAGSVSTGPASAAELVSTHSDWKAYRHGTGDQRMCFAVSEPNEAGPNNVKRESPHVYVTAWPKAGIKAEISVLVGLALKKNAEIEVNIDGNRFELFPDGDRAYVSDANDELKLLDAMRRGRSMTITATSTGGQETRDTYSLSGLTAAVQSMSSGCS
ncbi:MAG: invasion associated locus B family protein [Hyphomicrobiaceae bacterium]